VHECDRRQTTDLATEKWVAIGGIACARAISPKNRLTIITDSAEMFTFTELQYKNKIHFIYINKFMLSSSSSSSSSKDFLCADIQ